MTWELRLDLDAWPLVKPFRTANTCETVSETLTVWLTEGEHVGRGEASGVHYHGETAATIAKEIECCRPQLERGFDYNDLKAIFLPGGSRNALDCALWDLRAQQIRKPVWEVAGLPEPGPVRTTVTIGAATPLEMAETARQWGNFHALKIKLLGDAFDADRVAAVREARPDVWLAVDGNEGFTAQSLEVIIPTLQAAQVMLVEQPLPAGQDDVLADFAQSVDFAADESVQDASDIASLSDAYTMINIKLDKAGGFTPALELARAARASGRSFMVGNMVGTSLAMAPAWMIGQMAEIVDLDGPLLLSSERHICAQYAQGRMSCPTDIWGFPR